MSKSKHIEIVEDLH